MSVVYVYTDGFLDLTAFLDFSQISVCFSKMEPNIKSTFLSLVSKASEDTPAD